MMPQEAYRQVQDIAKAVLKALGASIRPADSERSIARRAAAMLETHGITETWYHDCPALVLSGSRSCLSVSGKDYMPSDNPIGTFNMVTVDLSPSQGGVWGDCARSFFIEAGQSACHTKTREFARGRKITRGLHQTMLDFVTLTTTFEELYRFANRLIASQGFENLDFLGNLGHSIAGKLEDRVYIAAGNRMKLSDVRYFTFEPHIRKVGGKWRFKHENIYYFGSDGRVKEL